MCKPAEEDGKLALFEVEGVAKVVGKPGAEDTRDTLPGVIGKPALPEVVGKSNPRRAEATASTISGIPMYISL